jgi:hypothetical protein
MLMAYPYVYPGYPQCMRTTNPEFINADLPAFFRA